MTNYFISPSGDDSNQGSKGRPFLTIAHGISQLKPGDVLNLREGNYVETLKIENLRGTSKKPIVIRSFDKEHATIDGSVTRFRSVDNNDWEPASLHDPNAVKDEFVSRARFAKDRKNRMNRGVFLDREPYTRLITHSRLEDLRSPNQTFVHPLPLGDLRDGPTLVDKNGAIIEGARNPWVYMGPGLFFNLDSGRVHIRLSHTTNNVKGLVDYTGETDPGKLRLAISSALMTTLDIKNSSFIRFENLSVRYGGEHCLLLEGTESIVFDHVQILAASVGVFFRKGNISTVLCHCEIRGGIPSWYFRSDRKAEYDFLDDNTNNIATNQLGKATSLGLIGGTKENRGIGIYNCELLDAHDITLFGRDVMFHHNWIDNLNDDSLFVDALETNDNLQIFQNVFTRCLSAISYAGDKVSGQAFIYRNLFDLRQPTAGNRPKRVGDKNVFRQGQFFKDGEKPEGPLDLFHNTCLVLRLKGAAYYRHYANTQGSNLRRSFNNIFVAIDPDSNADKPITFIPPATFPGPTDGNCYFRISKATKKLFVVQQVQPFDTLKKLRSSPFFTQTMAQYPPGYEAVSIEGDPLFRRIGDITSSSEDDDLRLRSDSPARRQGVVLLSDLKGLDPLAPSKGRPDIGCYQYGKPGLRVGVEGRNHFPSSPGEVFESATKNRPPNSK